MLRSLQIRDFVIVDRLELEFATGFGALTGETGAGKSILLDALSLALGSRGEAGAVRAGCERAEICAGFELPAGGPACAWLDEQGIETEEGGVLLRRVIDAGGRSRAWINGTVVTLAQLRELGDLLADIHGQHAHHALLRAATQRELVDALGGDQALAAEVARRWRDWRDALDALAAARSDADRLARERELLEWQVDELRALAFDPEEWEALNHEQARLAHASALLEGAESARVALTESDAAMVSELERIAARLAALADFDGQLGEFAELLQSAAIQAGEAAHGLARYVERLDLDPQRLQQIDQRIAQVTDLARKYRVAPDELASLLERCAAELERMRATADPAYLAEQARRGGDAYREIAGRLSARRRDTAGRLAREVTDAMQTLAMAGGRFEVALLADERGAAHGLEDVEFQVSASAGQPLRPLAKVASGGELSRIGLAIQVIASREATTPTLIFDEVDVGIGGRVAEIVGQLLRRLGHGRQVLCVTHLAQVAAQADWQWSIAKEIRDGETLSRVEVLGDDARIEEIARMLGGVEITRATREHASEMLAQRR